MKFASKVEINIIYYLLYCRTQWVNTPYEPYSVISGLIKVINDKMYIYKQKTAERTPREMLGKKEYTGVYIYIYIWYHFLDTMTSNSKIISHFSITDAANRYQKYHTHLWSDYSVRWFLYNIQNIICKCIEFIPSNFTNVGN